MAENFWWNLTRKMYCFDGGGLASEITNVTIIFK